MYNNILLNCDKSDKTLCSKNIHSYIDYLCLYISMFISIEFESLLH